MTLQDTIKLFEILASHQPSVNMIVENDVFRLNSYADAKYGVFSFVQGQHSGTMDDPLITYNFTFFYVDRLLADSSNQIEVQSVGIQTLQNILRELNERDVFVDDYTFTSFNQRFLDECAGVMCNVSLKVKNGSMCGEDYPDFNEDFSDDFLIF